MVSISSTSEVRKRAIDFFEKKLDAGAATKGLVKAIETFLNEEYVVSTCVFPFFSADAPPNFRLVTGPRPVPGDFYCGYVRHGCDRRFDTWPAVYTVRRDGVLLNVCRDLRRGRGGRHGGRR